MSVLEEREAVIRELRDTIEILQAKMTKMEQLSKLKDSKIESLLKRIEEGTWSDYLSVVLSRRNRRLKTDEGHKC